jgi:hypothetical protein
MAGPGRRAKNHDRAHPGNRSTGATGKGRRPVLVVRPRVNHNLMARVVVPAGMVPQCLPRRRVIAMASGVSMARRLDGTPILAVRRRGVKPASMARVAVPARMVPRCLPRRRVIATVSGVSMARRLVHAVVLAVRPLVGRSSTGRVVVPARMVPRCVGARRASEGRQAVLKRQPARAKRRLPSFSLTHQGAARSSPPLGWRQMAK